MNYRAVGWAYDLPLKGSPKPVLTALADMADEANSCYPGQDTIARMSGLSTRTVRRALDSLEACGLIRREERRDRLGHRTSDRYWLEVGKSLPDIVTGSGENPNRTLCPSLPDTVSIPTGHSVPVTTRRTTRENHQSDTGSVSPVTNVLNAPRSARSDRFEPDVVEYSKLARIHNLSRVYRQLAKTVKGPITPTGAIELAIVLTDRSRNPVQDVDAYIATACRDTPADVRRWYAECDLGAA